MPEAQKSLPKELEKLLEPTSENPPCGKDLWLEEGRYRLQQPLEEAAKPDAKANWTEMCDLAVELMSASRDLRIAVLLCLTLFKTRGLPGFHDGLVLIHGLMEKFWDQLHPLPDDANDPVRTDTLSDLAALKFIKLLRAAPLCQSGGGAAYSLADLDRADSGKAPEDPAAKPFATREQITAMFGASQERLQQTHQLVEAILEEVQAMETFAAAKSGGKNWPGFDKLKETLDRMELETKGPETASAAGQDTAAKVASAGDAPPGGVSLPGGVIRSRAEVDAALVAVCQYFRQCEPASPVPFLIERARRLLKLDFIESLRELAPDSVERFHPLLGTKEKENPGSQS